MKNSMRLLALALLMLPGAGHGAADKDEVKKAVAGLPFRAVE